jgi:hypothetical protein
MVSGLKLRTFKSWQRLSNSKMAFVDLSNPNNLEIQYKKLSVKVNFGKKISDLNLGLKREFTSFCS